MKLALLSGLVLLVNLPFGYWRRHSKRFSLQWFLAIHLPVALMIALRILGGVGWHIVPHAVLVGAFFAGQFLGGRLHAK